MDTQLITGRVIKVLDNCQVVINRGKQDGVALSQKYLVYREDEELNDPDTGESLGKLEVICGRGIVTHVQPKMATLKTADERIRQPKTVIHKNYYNGTFTGTFTGGFIRPSEQVEEKYEEPEVIEIPFDNVGTDCLVRRIS